MLYLKGMHWNPLWMISYWDLRLWPIYRWSSFLLNLFILCKSNCWWYFPTMMIICISLVNCVYQLVQFESSLWEKRMKVEWLVTLERRRHWQEGTLHHWCENEQCFCQGWSRMYIASLNSVWPAWRKKSRRIRMTSTCHCSCRTNHGLI